MAERNDDDQLTNFSELIEKSSRSDKDSKKELSLLGPQLIKVLDNLKCTDRRKQLDALLGKMNQILNHLDSVKRKLETDETAFPGDKPHDKVLLEIDSCRSRIAEIHDLVIECLKKHTELYFMIEDVREFITNFENFNLDLNFSTLSKSEVLKSIFYGFAVTGGIVGVGGVVVTSMAMCTAVGGGVLAAYGTIGPLAGASCIILGVGGTVFGTIAIAIGVLIAIVGGVGWGITYMLTTKPTQDELLQNIQKICMELEDNNTLGKLQAFKEQFDVRREELKARLNSESYADLNIVMKCYKEYKRGLEEGLEDLSPGMTKEHLRGFLAAQYSIPLRKRFNLSKLEAKQLILAFHDMVTRRKLK